MCEYCNCNGCDESGDLFGLDNKTVETPLFNLRIDLDLDKYANGDIFICASACGDKDVIVAEKKINYCPFCGRKL